MILPRVAGKLRLYSLAQPSYAGALLGKIKLVLRYTTTKEEVPNKNINKPDTAKPPEPDDGTKNHTEPKETEFSKVKLKKVNKEAEVPKTNIQKPDNNKPPENKEGTKHHAPKPERTIKGTNTTNNKKPTNTVMNFVKKFNNLNENLREPEPGIKKDLDLKKGTKNVSNSEVCIRTDGTTDRKEPDKKPPTPDTKLRGTRNLKEPKPAKNQKLTPRRTKPKTLQPDGTLKLKEYLLLKSAIRNEKLGPENLSISDAEPAKTLLNGKTTEAIKESGNR